MGNVFLLTLHLLIRSRLWLEVGSLVHSSCWKLAPTRLQSHSLVGVDGGSSILPGSRSVVCLVSSTKYCNTRRVWRIPGGTLQLVTAICSEQFLHDTVLFEPPESGLPAGLLASPALVQVSRGTVSVPVVNVGTTDVVLHPRTHLDTLTSVYVVSLPSGVTEVKTVVATISA